ncbi:hypothetical protein E3N88_39975 [Mikania micrantha]|uniref:Uncharacterized protein n=1 Tax=Mikania micrantha TaxID=192012 RepID=A0A5N6LNJ1_9ASTR|nr:hypothetical protein E3N88_39975 [Mikania micrantha]
MMTPQWTSVLRCSWLQYDELTVEFLCTFQYDTGSLTHPEAVSFALRRQTQTHTMSVAQFAVAFGLYSQEQVAAPDFEGLLRGSARAAMPGFVADDDLSAFWGTISTQPNTDRRLVSQIRDPFLRYIHRILGSTLIPRRSGMDKHVTRGPETTPYELYDMQTARMVTFDAPPHWMPMLPAPEHASAVPPPSTHRILHQGERPTRDAPPRPPVRPRLTHRYLLQRLDKIEDSVRRIAAHFEVELAPRMPDPHLPSDPEGDTDTEPDDGGDQGMCPKGAETRENGHRNQVRLIMKKTKNLTLGGTPSVTTWCQALHLASSAARIRDIRAHRLATAAPLGDVPQMNFQPKTLISSPL